MMTKIQEAPPLPQPLFRNQNLLAQPRGQFQFGSEKNFLGRHSLCSPPFLFFGHSFTFRQLLFHIFHPETRIALHKIFQWRFPKPGTTSTAVLAQRTGAFALEPTTPQQLLYLTVNFGFLSALLIMQSERTIWTKRLVNAALVLCCTAQFLRVFASTANRPSLRRQDKQEAAQRHCVGATSPPPSKV